MIANKHSRGAGRRRILAREWTDWRLAAHSRRTRFQSWPQVRSSVLSSSILHLQTIPRSEDPFDHGFLGVRREFCFAQNDHLAYTHTYAGRLRQFSLPTTPGNLQPPFFGYSIPVGFPPAPGHQNICRLLLMATSDEVIPERRNEGNKPLSVYTFTIWTE